MKVLPKNISLFLFFISVLSLYSCNPVSELYLIKQNNKWGYIDKNGKQVIAPVYESCCIQRQEDTCCSRIIWPSSIGIIKKRGKYGAIDSKGNIKIKPQYEFLDQYYNSLIIAKSERYYGILNENGDTIFPFMFDNQFINCNNEVGHGQINGKLYLLDFVKQTKKETNFDKISYFTEGLAGVKKDDKYGYIDKKGNLVIDFQFQDVWPFNKGLAAVKQNYEWGFIDTCSQFVIMPQFDETQGFDLITGEIAIVVKNKKYGVINREGKYIIPLKYEYLYLEDKNVLNATLKENNSIKKGLINLNEKWLSRPITVPFDYFNGYIKLYKESGCGIYKLKSGKIIAPCVFDDIAFRSFGLTMLIYYDEKTAEEHFAYINKKGKVIWSEEGFDVESLMKNNR